MSAAQPFYEIDTEPLGYAPAFFPEPGLIEDLSKITIHPDAYYSHPQGHRVRVVLSKRTTEYGLIKLPESAQGSQVDGEGWVFAVGPLVGAWNQDAYPGGPILKHPRVLIGTKVSMHAFTGTTHRFSLDPAYDAEVVDINDREIITVTWEPDVTTPEAKLLEDIERGQRLRTIENARTV